MAFKLILEDQKVGANRERDVIETWSLYSVADLQIFSVFRGSGVLSSMCLFVPAATYDSDKAR